MKRSYEATILENIRKIMLDRHLTQAVLAEYVGTSASQFSKMLKGDVKLTLEHISNLATNLSMSEIDILTYPDKYIKVGNVEQEPVEAILQIKLKKDKKDQVLKLVFGENNIEILNK